MPAALEAVLGGWQVSGIATFSQGQFQTPTLGTDWMLRRHLHDVASRRHRRSGRRAVRCLMRYLNPAAFDFPRDAQGNRIRVQGNAGRNSIQQPGINNWDIGLFKNFRFGNRFNAQFRWETFNTWNHTQFGSANLNTSSPTFGRITGLRVRPAPDAVRTALDVLIGPR